jgi:transcriptional regulator with XRE-family HTH domain
MTVMQLLSNREVKGLCRTGRAREIREAAGVSQSALARQLGVSRSLLRIWEAGTGMPNEAHAASYAEALSVLFAHPSVEVTGQSDGAAE